MAVSKNELLLKERIKFLLNEYGLTASSLGDNVAEKKRFQRQVHNDNTCIPFDTIFKILDMFPKVDANWFVMNEGNVYKNEHLAPHIYNQHNEVHSNSAGGDINVGPDTVVTKKTVDTLQAIIGEQRKRIAELENDKTLLSGLLAQFTNKHDRHS